MSSMYYIRAHGKVSGPFTEGKLKNMQQAGEFSSAYEVSKDQRNWESASDLIQSFRQRKVRAPVQQQIQSPVPLPEKAGELKLPCPEDVRKATPEIAHGDWYYSRKGQQSITPVSIQTLIQMLESGTLAASDHVIQSGDQNWLLVSDHPVLRAYLGGEAVSESAVVQSWISAGSGLLSVILVVLTMIPFVSKLRQGGFVPGENLTVMFLGLSALFCSVIAIFLGHSVLSSLKHQRIPRPVGRLLVTGLSGGYTTLLTLLILTIILIVHLMNSSAT